MKVTERRSKSWVCGETHLKQMIKHNARSGLTMLIYVKRCIKSPPRQIISIYNSFSRVPLELWVLHVQRS